jgi:hypothetical protein
LRYRQMRPEVARDALLATHGGLSVAQCVSSAISRPEGIKYSSNRRV